MAKYALRAGKIPLPMNVSNTKGASKCVALLEEKSEEMGGRWHKHRFISYPVTDRISQEKFT